MISYYDTCSVEFLIEEANLAFWPDDTIPMIRSLYKREPERAIELARDIIDKKKGEEYMQEEAKAFLISKNAWKSE